MSQPRIHLRPLPFRDAATARRSQRLAGGWLTFAEIEAVDPDEGSGTAIVPLIAASTLYPEARPVIERLAGERRDFWGCSLVSPIVVSRESVPFARQEKSHVVWTPDGLSPPHRVPRSIAMATNAQDAFAAGAQVWQPVDWQALWLASELPKLCLVTPPCEKLHDAQAVYRCFDALASKLSHLDHCGVDRSRLAVDIGCPGTGAFSSLSVFHGLGCAIFMDVDIGEAEASGAAAIAAAGQGIQYLATHNPERVALALDTWLATTGGVPK